MALMTGEYGHSRDTTSSLSSLLSASLGYEHTTQHPPLSPQNYNLTHTANALSYNPQLVWVYFVDSSYPHPRLFAW